MTTFSWCCLFLLAVDELWTFSQFEHSSILVRETNPTKHLWWFLLIPSTSFIQPGRSEQPPPLPASGHPLLALPEARERRNVKTNSNQARNTQLVHAGTSPHWSQLWIKDCRESNYLAPYLDLFHLHFSSTLPLPREWPLAALSLGTDPGTVFAVWSTDCL